jgi:hypothetical protein
MRYLKLAGNQSRIEGQYARLCQHQRIDLFGQYGELECRFYQEKMPQKERLIKLNQIAIQQMKVLVDDEGRRLLK